MQFLVGIACTGRFYSQFRRNQTQRTVRVWAGDGPGLADDKRVDWYGQPPAGWPPHPDRSIRTSVVGMRRTLLSATELRELDETIAYSELHISTGLPFQSWWSVQRSKNLLANGAYGPDLFAQSQFAVKLGGELRAFTGIPYVSYGVHWLPFVGNSLVYSTSLFAMLWLWRRKRKEARLQWAVVTRTCHVCGYPVGKSPVCTECGTDLHSVVGFVEMHPR